VLEAAERRFRDSPPSIRGTFEYRSGAETITYELWVDWPAFRLSMSAAATQGATADGTHKPLVIATQDGKAFGVRDPLSSDPYVTRTFGEAPWILGPVLDLFGDSQRLTCTSGQVVGADTVLGRSSILFRCRDPERFDTWVDTRTGLVLREVLTTSTDGEPGWSGFVELQFEPLLDHSLFRPPSV
jgi:hypothetical protein